ncbi:Ankyrin repeat domain-containing protein 50 [Symbiodinium microadriaticum]|uniref:Ankyrin repeat domain-containing protein 50 n=1 Tax=Symbiodinium microadriaticum TaxID=2951 RepID=A0A1Q9CXQ0_SYMMI|nr:Ankyrin repeat domain-containing protein 50 [Symbiodinium microadriaticum]
MLPFCKFCKFAHWPAQKQAVFKFFPCPVRGKGIPEARARGFRIRGKRTQRNAASMKLKWSHKKSKDVREHFAALARAAYQDNRSKADSFRNAQSKRRLPSEEEAVEVRQQKAIEADRQRTVVLEDSWTWTLGVAFRDLVEVGSGAHGQVFRATFQNQPLALKLAKGRGLQDPMQRAAAGTLDVAEEFAVLGALGQHPNVVRAFAVLTSSLGRPALVLEWATESLHELARRLKDDRLENTTAGRDSLLQLFQQFLVGLSFVHGRSFLHLDVKPSNILVFEGVRAALADFGHAESVRDNETGCTVVGNRVYTEAFRCAECLMAADRKVRVTFAGDIWAAAVSLFEICCPKKTSLWTIAPQSFLRASEEQTAKAIRDMAVAKSSKFMPFDGAIKDILTQTFVPANRRLTLPAMLQIVQKDVRSTGALPPDDRLQWPEGCFLAGFDRNRFPCSPACQKRYQTLGYYCYNKHKGHFWWVNQETQCDPTGIVVFQPDTTSSRMGAVNHIAAQAAQMMVRADRFVQPVSLFYRPRQAAYWSELCNELQSQFEAKFSMSLRDSTQLGRSIYMQTLEEGDLCGQANELAIGVLMPLAWTQTQIATTVCFHLDVRKNFEPAIRARFGEPIVTIPDLHPGVANVTIRMGTTDMQPEVGVATAIDFMLGLDGELPISGLVGTRCRSDVFDNYPYFLRTISPDSIQALAFWNWLVARMKKCIYTTEPYGQGLFTAVQDLAKLDGQEDRIKGQGLRYMPQNYAVFSEARATAELAKGLGSKFVFLMINSQVVHPMLRIRMLSGEEVAAMPVEELRDVKELKQQLNRLHGLPTRFRQRLFVCGTLLDDSAPLDLLMELELVLLSYSATSQTQTEELVTASTNGSVTEVEAILQQPRHPDFARSDGFTALMAASRHGHVEVVRLLLEAGAETNNNGTTALMLASLDGHLEVASLLLDAAADINLADSVGATALTAVSRRGHVEVVRLLLEANADTNLAHNDGFTGLQLASFKGHVEVARLLLEAGADKNLADGAGITALMIASQKDHLEVVRLLLAAGADRNLPDSDGDTALMFASVNGHVEVVRLLLETGADKNSADRAGMTALLMASQHSHVEVVRLLLEAGADKNLADGASITALMMASHKGDVEVVRLLLDAGADKNLANSVGVTALMAASLKGHVEVARLLLDAGADKDLANNSGFNALNIASAHGHVEVARLLLAAGTGKNSIKKRRYCLSDSNHDGSGKTPGAPNFPIFPDGNLDESPGSNFQAGRTSCPTFVSSSRHRKIILGDFFVLTPGVLQQGPLMRLNRQSVRAAHYEAMATQSKAGGCSEKDETRRQQAMMMSKSACIEELRSPVTASLDVQLMRPRLFLDAELGKRVAELKEVLEAKKAAMKTIEKKRQHMLHQRGGVIHGPKREPGAKKKAGLAKAKAAVRERVSELA